MLSNPQSISIVYFSAKHQLRRHLIIQNELFCRFNSPTGELDKTLDFVIIRSRKNRLIFLGDSSLRISFFAAADPLRARNRPEKPANGIKNLNSASRNEHKTPTENKANITGGSREAKAVQRGKKPLGFFPTASRRGERPRAGGSRAPKRLRAGPGRGTRRGQEPRKKQGRSKKNYTSFFLRSSFTLAFFGGFCYRWRARLSSRPQNSAAASGCR